MELTQPKGTRDFLPEKQIFKQEITEKIKKIFELYGYSPIETPVFEKMEVLASKYAGGEEITKEIFSFTDQGKRELGLKYDLTVPLARVIAINPALRMPFKRYQIERVFRDGPVTTSRYREFYQCDIDVIGTNSMMADAEIVKIASEVFKKLKLDVEIRLNDRKLLNGLMEELGIEKEKVLSVLLAIDKLDKIPKKEVEKELKEKDIEEKTITKIFELIEIKGKNEEILGKLEKKVSSDEGKQGIKELKEILSYAKEYKINNLYITVNLVRGLAYYTGPIFEILLKKGKVKSSVGGGGRYDKMIGLIAGKKEFPATGISFGLERILDELNEKSEKRKKTVTQIFIIPINCTEKAISLTEKIRVLGINAEMDLMERSISKNLDFASKQGIPFVIVLGEKEIKAEEFSLKDMQSGKEIKVKFSELEKLKDFLK
ncbi:MAG: histidine--tRNA ligase [Candidatus Micrarchaeota archaeon]|nr:histidine--tRNA ligase [Candidatus Micrarchaeota archaeon]